MSAVDAVEEETVPGWDIVGPIGDGTPPSYAEPLAEAGWTVDQLVEEAFGFIVEHAVAEPLAGPPLDPPPPIEEEPEPEPGEPVIDAEFEFEAAIDDPTV